LVIQQPFMATDMIFGTALAALKKERRWLCVALAAAVFNPAVNLVAMPLFQTRFHNGAIGAAIVEIATELLMFAGALTLLPRGTIDSETISRAARSVAAGAVVFSVASCVRVWSLPAAVLAGSLSYVIACALLRLVKLSDVISLWSLVAGDGSHPFFVSSGSSPSLGDS
jgi:hypothetical protein